MAIRRYPLRILLWESTQKCNAYCEFCGSRCGDTNISNELTKDEICHAWKQIADRYDATQIMINVTGGEPLMRYDLIEIMQYAVSLGFRWGLVTNGILLHENTIRKLKDAELKTVSISIDGLHETHDALRGVKGGLKAVIHNVHLLAQADFLETIMITTVVSRKNIAELDQIKELLKTLPIHIWRICPVDPIGRAANDNTLVLAPEQMQQVYEYIEHCQQEQLPFSVITSCSHYLGRYEFLVRSFPFQCSAGKTSGCILANGDIFVCPNVPRLPYLIQGNIRTDHFVDIWENGFQYFRDPENRHKGRCKTCQHFSQCQGDSLHTWDFQNAAPHFCMLDYNLEATALHQAPERTFDDVILEIKNGKAKISDAWVKAQSLSKDVVILTPHATQQLLAYFHWSESARSKEQICASMGHIYRNSEMKEESFIVCVHEILNLEATVATETQLAADEQLEMQLHQRLSQKQLSLAHIGYVHSHPNELEISMSTEDFKWHRKRYEQDWKASLTMILNPQRKQIAAYAGPAAVHVELHLIGYQECSDV